MIKYLIIPFIMLPVTANAILSDPTRPADVSISSLTDKSGLVLYATYISSGSRYAIINLKLVFIGNEVFGYKVVAIDKQSVELKKGDERVVLMIAGTGIKRS